MDELIRLISQILDTLFDFTTEINRTNPFRDALKGVKQDNKLSQAFLAKKNIQIIQNGLRAGVYKMSQKICYW